MSSITTFGPGSLEAITLELGERDARVTGGFRVYCGYGSEHPVAMAGTSVPLAECDHSAGDDLAFELVEREIEAMDWSDPCEETAAA